MNNSNWKRTLKKKDIIHYRNNTFEPSINHGLVGSVILTNIFEVYTAYCSHYNLKLRPDDFWNYLTLAFAKYVLKHYQNPVLFW